MFSNPAFQIPKFVEPCIILKTLIVMNKRRNYFASGYQWWWQAFVLPRGDFYSLYCVYSSAICFHQLSIWWCRWSIWAEKPSPPTSTLESEKSPSSGPISEILFRVIINTRISMIITNGHHHRCDHQIWVEDGSMHPQQWLQLFGRDLRSGNKYRFDRKRRIECFKHFQIHDYIQYSDIPDE